MWIWAILGLILGLIYCIPATYEAPSNEIKTVTTPISVDEWLDELEEWDIQDHIEEFLDEEEEEEPE